MSHRIIATQNRKVYEADGVTLIIELTKEKEIITDDEQLKEILLSWAWAEPYDDTKPLLQKGLGVYESGMVYEGKRFIIKGNAFYQSKADLVDNETSSTWVSDEWILMIQGV